MCNELSVLIPVFNVDVRPLVQTLHQQCLELGLLFEICCYDDGSGPDILALNQSLSTLSHTRYVVLVHHLGRVAIRNKLAREARYDYLLFLDNDSVITDPAFIRVYLQAAPLAPVLVGGTGYQAAEPARPYRLRWRYGRAREARSAARRNLNPYQAFYLNNLFLPRAIFLRFPLQPLLCGYGHEDSLFGRHLQAAGIPVLHISNPVVHAGLDPAPEFLIKTRQAIENLYWLFRQEGLAKETKLVRLYQALKKLSLLGPFLFGYRALASVIMRNLQGPDPCLWLFDLYKLYYFIQEAEKQQKPDR
jgi:glycosyltransferase involved in cell wall biosynthesis